MNDKITSVIGSVAIIVRNEHGKEILNETDSNLVVNTGYQMLPLMLCGAGSFISKIAVGDSGVIPHESDVSLTNQHLVDVHSFSFPTPRSIRFNATIDYYDAVGVSIRELGLYTQSGVLFSRKVREPIEKTQHMSIAVSWDIIF